MEYSGVLRSSRFRARKTKCAVDTCGINVTSLCVTQVTFIANNRLYQRGPTTALHRETFLPALKQPFRFDKDSPTAMEQSRRGGWKCNTMCAARIARCFLLFLLAQNFSCSSALQLSATISRRLNQGLPRCNEQVAICHANGSSELPLSEWNQILSRVSDVPHFDEVRSSIAKLTAIDFSNFTLLDSIESSSATEIITDFESSLSNAEGSYLLEETEITANQIGVIGEFLNVLNLIFDFIKRTTGLDLRFLTTVIGNVIAAQALGIGPILSAVLSGVTSLMVAIIERLAWVVVDITGLGVPSSPSICYSELMKCETSNMMITLVPGMVSGAFATMETDSEEGSP